MARPSKLDDELINKMYEAIKEGLPVRYACDLFVITQPSHSNWMRRGEEDVLAEDYDSIYAKYFVAIKKAQAEYVYEANKDIKSGRPGWQGAAWWLERTRQDFCPRQQIDAGPDGKVEVIIGGKVKEVKNKDDNIK